MNEEIKRPKLPNSVILFQAFSMLAAHNLSYTAMKILFVFFSESGYGNYVSVDVYSLAERLKLTKKTVIVGLKELTQFNIVVKSKTYLQDKRRNEYYINPLAAWRGKDEKRVQAIAILKKEGVDLRLTTKVSKPLPTFEETKKREQIFLGINILSDTKFI